MVAPYLYERATHKDFKGKYENKYVKERPLLC